MSWINKIRSNLSDMDLFVGIIAGLMLMAMDSVLVLFFNCSDLIYFFSLIAAFFIGALFGLLLSKKMMLKIKLQHFFEKAYTKDIKRQSLLCTSIVLITCICFWITDYLPLNQWAIDKDELAWHKNIIYSIFVCLFTAIVIFIINCSPEIIKLNFKVKPIVWAVYYVFIAILVVIPLWQPSTDIGYSIYHRHAYIYEIYARYNSIPYSFETSSVYGHYGMVILPILRLLGNCSINTITIIIALLAAISSLLLSLAVHNVTNNTIIKIVAPLAFSFPYFWSTKIRLYYQGYPHRILLIAILCFLLSKALQNQTSKLIWIARHILTIFALLWCNDIGIVFWISVLVWDILEIICRKNTKIIFLFGSIGIALVEITIALLAVNIYNVIVGGEVVFADYFYPFTTNYVSTLEVGLIDKSHSGFFSLSFWFAYFWILFFYLSVGFVSVLKSVKKYDNQKSIDMWLVVAAVASVFGVGAMIYYINRSAYGNLLLTVPSLIFVFCVLSKKEMIVFSTIRKSFSQIREKLIKSFVTIMAIATVVSIPVSLPSLINNNKNPDFVRESATALETMVPENTYCVGIGAYEVCSVINWNNISPYDDIHISYSKEAQADLYQSLINCQDFVIFTYYFGGSFIDRVPGLQEKLNSDYCAVESYYDTEFGLNWTYYVRK